MFQHRGGNYRLENAMFITAFAATQLDPDANVYHQRERGEEKRHNPAVICVARRSRYSQQALELAATPGTAT